MYDVGLVPFVPSVVKIFTYRNAHFGNFTEWSERSSCRSLVFYAPSIKNTSGHVCQLDKTLDTNPAIQVYDNNIGKQLFVTNLM